MKDQIYSEESTASGNRKSPIISCNRWSYSNDDVIEQKTDDITRLHGDDILSIFVYRSKSPIDETTINVRYKNMSNEYILPTNMRSKNINTSKLVRVRSVSSKCEVNENISP